MLKSSSSIASRTCLSTTGKIGNLENLRERRTWHKSLSLQIRYLSSHLLFLFRSLSPSISFLSFLVCPFLSSMRSIFAQLLFSYICTHHNHCSMRNTAHNRRNYITEKLWELLASSSIISLETRSLSYNRYWYYFEHFSINSVIRLQKILPFI